MKNKLVGLIVPTLTILSLAGVVAAQGSTFSSSIYIEDCDYFHQWFELEDTGIEYYYNDILGDGENIAVNTLFAEGSSVYFEQNITADYFWGGFDQWIEGELDDIDVDFEQEYDFYSYGGRVDHSKWWVTNGTSFFVESIDTYLEDGWIYKWAEYEDDYEYEYEADLEGTGVSFSFDWVIG